MIYNSINVLNFVRIIVDYKKDNYACSYTEIAERLNLTRNQVIAIERRAMKKIKEIVTDLYDYMKTHFSHEEKFMQDINYPKSEEHKKLHREIILKINEFVKQLPTMNISDFEKELAKIIDISLVHHIIQEDRKIIAWERMNPHKK